MRHRLTLRRDALLELTGDDLRAVAAAGFRGGVVHQAACAAVAVEPAHTVRCVVAGCTCYCT